MHGLRRKFPAEISQTILINRSFPGGFFWLLPLAEPLSFFCAAAFGRPLSFWAAAGVAGLF
ncbi:hypothetical protein DOM22_12665 [Bdellovibrio sp. ZAP7]|nr:hypothetical protein DOM22_12665 [Bdellovibrio sp. ZAP7]